ncbi:MAG: peptidylprolyl isomerase [Gammaproteobacteria bacterium]
MRLTLLINLALGLALGLAAAAARAEPLDRIVAVVNDGVVLQSEFDRALGMSRRQLAERKLQAPPDSVLRTQVLERLVLTRVQTQKAAEAGIRVDDRELNEVLAGLAAQNKMSLADFAVAVKKEGMEYGALREQIREEITIQRLRARELEQRVVVNEQDINLFLANQSRLDQTQFRVSHILVAVPDAAPGDVRAKARARAEALLKRLQAGEDFAQVAISNSDGQQALAGGDLDWRNGTALPELFANAVQGLLRGELSPVLENASGFHILKLADVRGGEERKSVTETHVQHVLLRPNALRNEEQTKQEIRQLHERIVKGEDLGEIAKKVSDDTGTKAEGGDLGWQPAGTFAPEFEKETDPLKPGQVSAPFRTQFGWHVAKVLERRSRDATDETRRARARAVIQNRKAAEEYDMWLRRLRAEAYVEIRLDKSAAPKTSS